jgi:hypothetical protein
MNEQQYREWQLEREIRAAVVIPKAEELRKSESPSKLAIWAMDGVLRAVLTDIHYYWATWSFFREQNGVEPNHAVIEGWEPPKER